MMPPDPIERDEQRIDMQAALQQARVYVHDAPIDARCPYVVLASATEDPCPTVNAWYVDVDGWKSDRTSPSPLPVARIELRPLTSSPSLQAELFARNGPASGASALAALEAFAQQAQANLAALGRGDEALAIGRFRSYLQRFGLPDADDQQALINALVRTTDAVRKVFRDSCEQKPFARGSECDDKLQALCEGDIALHTIGERDSAWTEEKANVAQRQGWRIAPASDGAPGLTITAVRGGRLPRDLDAYAHVCSLAKQGDLLALTACKAAGIRIAGVDDYRPPVLVARRRATNDPPEL